MPWLKLFLTKILTLNQRLLNFFRWCPIVFLLLLGWCPIVLLLLTLLKDLPRVLLAATVFLVCLILLTHCHATFNYIFFKSRNGIFHLLIFKLKFRLALLKILNLIKQLLLIKLAILEIVWKILVFLNLSLKILLNVFVVQRFLEEISIKIGNLLLIWVNLTLKLFLVDF